MSFLLSLPDAMARSHAGRRLPGSVRQLLKSSAGVGFWTVATSIAASADAPANWLAASEDTRLVRTQVVNIDRRFMAALGHERAGEGGARRASATYNNRKPSVIARACTWSRPRPPAAARSERVAAPFRGPSPVQARQDVGC